MSSLDAKFMTFESAAELLTEDTEFIEAGPVKIFATEAPCGSPAIVVLNDMMAADPSVMILL